jgi:DAK2 domain fusion protein YloV
VGVNQIDSKLLAKVFIAGAKNLEANKEWINELNVFPVPDGDTGTNMTMTIMSAAKEVSDLGAEPDMASLCKAISSGSLRGARGNSGVILSQLLRGFTKTVKTEELITIPLMVTAFNKAVETAYKAVMKPKEGTILTVARGMSDKANDLAEAGCDDLEKFCEQILEHGKAVLEQTPEMLPVLKEAGVVDSGGQGLIQFLQGAFDAYLGKEVDLTIGEPAAEEEKEEEVALQYLYSVEYKVKLERNFIPKNETDLKAYLESVGESVVLINDGSELHIHIHTNEPGHVLSKGLKYGSLNEVKIVNRATEQDSDSKEEEKPAFSEPPKPFGFITVAAGDGLVEIFKSLGVDYVIEGGQTMNPSTADFIDAASKVNAETIFILPNNKNIILAANQAAELVTDKNLLVIPSKTVPQGITAVINFIADLSADENEATMMEEIKNVKTGQVTYAVRDTSIDGKEIHKDDYMGLSDSGLASVGTDKNKVIEELIESMVDDSSELISIYYGQDVTEEEASAVSDMIQAKYSKVDVELQPGGQPVYYYMISVE